MKRNFAACLAAFLAFPLIALSQTPPVNPGSGSLTVTSTPSGAEVRLQGEAEVTGVTPTTFRFPLIGDYKITVRKYGFEKYSTRLTMDPLKDMDVTVRLSPKTRTKAAVRSLFIPGWGQRYAEHNGKGIVFHFLAASSIVAFLIADDNFDSKYNTFKNRETDYKRALDTVTDINQVDLLRIRMNSARDDASRAEDTRRITIGAVAGVWALSVVDALLFSPEEAGTFSVKGNEVSIRPDSDFQGVKVAVTTRF